MGSNRRQRAHIAEETLRILEQGGYYNQAGEHVPIASSLTLAQEASRLYRPNDFQELEVFLKNGAQELCAHTQFEVTNETTLHAAQRLVAEEAAPHILCLNFASAKNPGGGFLGGSQAQEESLARASGLYPCLTHMHEYYEANRCQKSCFYTDHMIYSPDIPVFRDDQNTLLDCPYTVSILTAPAVNRGAVSQYEPHRLAQVNAVMSQRIAHVLAICAYHHHTTLILGAWGCGVFQNAPEDIAQLFAYHLYENTVFAQRFQKVVFAVLDHSHDLRIIRPFTERFCGGTS